MSKAKKNSNSSGRKLTDRFKKAASSQSGRVHVVHGKDGWSVKKEGAKRSSVVKSSKSEAVKAAKSFKSVDRVVVHKKDGTIHKNTKVTR